MFFVFFIHMFLKIVSLPTRMSRRASSRVQANSAKEDEKAKSLAAPFNLKWKDVSDYFYVLDTKDGMEASTKIAGFDLVSTFFSLQKRN